MKRISWCMLLAVCTAVAGCGGGEPGKGTVSADKSDPDKGGDAPGDGGADSDAANALEMKYVLPGYDVAVIAHPQRAWASKFGDRIEGKDIFPKLFLEQSGIDARTVERVLVLAKVPAAEALTPRGPAEAEFQESEVADGEFRDPPPQPEQPVMVLWFSGPVDVPRFLEAAKGTYSETPFEHGDVACYRNEWTGKAVAFPNSETMYFGSPDALKQLIDAEAPRASPLADRLAEQSLDADVVVVAELAEHRQSLKAMADNSGLPPAADPALAFADRVDTVVLRIDLSNATMLDLLVTAVDEQAAGDIETAATESVQGLLNMVQGAKVVAAPESAALLGVAENILEGLAVSRDAATIRAIAPAPDDWSPVVAVVNKAVAAAEKAARQTKHRRGLKQVGIALLNFHDIFGGFPAVAAYRGADGTPLLSWRVAILPMLDEGELFDQFALDEPWDSEHNLALLEKMPEAFRTPGVEKPGTTGIVAVVGPGTGLGDLAVPSEMKPGVQSNVRLRDIIDGSSGTIVALETTDGAVPWTKPADVPFDAEQAEALLAGAGDDGLMVLLADGYVAFLDPQMPVEIFRQMLVRNDGEFPDWFEYRK